MFLQKKKCTRGLCIRDWKGNGKDVFSFVREQQIYIAKKNKLNNPWRKMKIIHIHAFGKYILYSKMKIKFLGMGINIFFVAIRLCWTEESPMLLWRFGEDRLRLGSNFLGQTQLVKIPTLPSLHNQSKCLVVPFRQFFGSECSKSFLL